MFHLGKVLGNNTMWKSGCWDFAEVQLHLKLHGRWNFMLPSGESQLRDQRRQPIWTISGSFSKVMNYEHETLQYAICLVQTWVYFWFVFLLKIFIWTECRLTKIKAMKLTSPTRYVSKSTSMPISMLLHYCLGARVSTEDYRYLCIVTHCTILARHPTTFIQYRTRVLKETLEPSGKKKFTVLHFASPFEQVDKDGVLPRLRWVLSSWE